MRFLIVNMDYQLFINDLYAAHPGLDKQRYEEQMRVRNESLFGMADFYSSNLRKLGHEAWDIRVNNEFMQKAWAREYGIQIGESTPAERRAKMVLQRIRCIARNTPLQYVKPLFRPVLRSLVSQPTWFYEALAAQIKHYKPDVLLNLAMGSVSSGFLKEVESYVRLLMGQIASSLPQGEDFHVYDLVISSLPNLVEHFRRLGVPSELNRLAFEPAVLLKLEDQGPEIPVSFVGSLSAAHQSRVRLLEYLCSHLEISVWGNGVDRLSQGSPIRSKYKSTAWGVEMYQILHRSKITINHHIDVAESYANNLRLFEATGVGTLLITDWKENLYEMFEPGREVVAYRSPEECVELVQYYLDHNDEREAIARAGQERTLQEHTYYHRMQELLDILTKYM